MPVTGDVALAEAQARRRETAASVFRRDAGPFLSGDARLDGEGDPGNERTLVPHLQAVRVHSGAVHLAPEGMAGIDERQAEDLSQLHGDITRIRIMAMDDVGNGIPTLDISNDSIHVLIKMRPETLFAHVFFAAALHADNAEFVIDALDGPGVVFGYSLIVDQACKELHPLYMFRLTERPAQFDSILDLTACVGIMP